MKVFVVQHAYMKVSENYFGVEEDVKFIGVYSTEEKAQEAVERLRKQPGFMNWQNGFHIDSYTLDKDHWSDGFAPFIGDYHQCRHSTQNLNQNQKGGLHQQQGEKIQVPLSGSTLRDIPLNGLKDAK